MRLSGKNIEPIKKNVLAGNVPKGEVRSWAKTLPFHGLTIRFNPWIGCSKVSAGCTHCYAETLMDKRLGKVQWGPQGTRIRTSSDNWKQPLKWNRKAEKDGVRRKVFCASLADIFEDHLSIDSQWRTNLFQMIEVTKNLDWLLLTKRPENVMRFLPDYWNSGVRENVWIGTTAENQENYDKRAPILMEIPAKVRFLSIEPMLGPINLFDISRWEHPEEWWGKRIGIDWVICGGESGAGARPMELSWPLSLLDQCQDANIPYFFKQGSQNNWPDFKNFDSFPEDLKIREFPNV